MASIRKRRTRGDQRHKKRTHGALDAVSTRYTVLLCCLFYCLTPSFVYCYCAGCQCHAKGRCCCDDEETRQSHEVAHNHTAPHSCCKRGSTPKPTRECCACESQGNGVSGIRVVEFFPAHKTLDDKDAAASPGRSKKCQVFYKLPMNVSEENAQQRCSVLETLSFIGDVIPSVTKDISYKRLSLSRDFYRVHAPPSIRLHLLLGVLLN